MLSIHGRFLLIYNNHYFIRCSLLGSTHNPSEFSFHVPMFSHVAVPELDFELIATLYPPFTRTATKACQDTVTPRFSPVMLLFSSSPLKPLFSCGLILPNPNKPQYRTTHRSALPIESVFPRSSPLPAFLSDRSPSRTRSLDATALRFLSPRPSCFRSVAAEDDHRSLRFCLRELASLRLIDVLWNGLCLFSFFFLFLSSLRPCCGLFPPSLCLSAL